MAPNGIKLSHEYDGQQPPPKNIPPFWVFFDVGFPRTPFRCKVAISILLGKRRSYQDWRSDGSEGRGDGMKKSFDFFWQRVERGSGGGDPDSIEEGRRSAMKKKKNGDPRGLQIICCDKGKKVLRCTLCLFS